MLSKLNNKSSLIFILFVTVLATTILHVLKVGFSQNQGIFYPLLLPVSWSSPFEMFQNFLLSLQGYSQGYVRTIKGYTIFCLMSLFFISVGRLFLDLIFNRNQRMNSNYRDLNIFEKLSYSYLIGALFSSLLWLLLGVSGILSTWVAWFVLCLGILLFILQNRAFNPQEFIRNTITTARNMGSLEKSLMIFILALLLILSTFSFHPVSHVDPLFSEIALPSFYIQAGEVRSYPYHIYSYIAQNIQMLIMWSLLLGSDMSAALIIWGFLIAMVVSVFGFFLKRTSCLTALLTVVVLLSAPLIIQQSIIIKPDIPAAAFIFAFFTVLFQAFNMKNESSIGVGRWFILAGIFCGGAVGFKQFNLVIVAISICLIFIFDFLYFNSSRKRGMLVLWLMVGFFVATSFWFIRSFLETGNPLYPFLNDYLGIIPVKPWHGKTEFTHFYGFIREGWTGLMNYFWSLFYMSKNYLWGPSIVFALGSIIFIRNSFPVGLKICSLIAWLSWFVLLPYAYQSRFHIGLIAWLVTSSFAFIIDPHIKKVKHKYYHWILSILTLSYLLYFYSHAHIWKIIDSSLAIVSSGYSAGNFKTQHLRYNDWYWMCHLINTRSNKSDIFLLAEVPSAYGLKRKIIFNFGHDKRLLVDLAEKYRDPQNLALKLKNLGVTSLVVGNYSKNNYGIDPQVLKTIKELLKKYTDIKWTSPGFTVTWHTLSHSKKNKNIPLNIDDATRFPLSFLDAAAMNYLQNKPDETSRLLAFAESVPMVLENREKLIDLTNLSGAVNRIYGLIAFARYYDDQGENYIAAKFYEAAIELKPYAYEAHLGLAKIYFKTKQYLKAEESFSQAQNINPSDFNYYNEWCSLLAQQGQLEQALDCFAKGIKYVPLSYDLNVNLGYLKLFSKNRSSASINLKKAFEIDSNRHEAYLFMGILNAENKNYGQALENFQRAYQINPKDQRTKKYLKMIKNLNSRDTILNSN